MSLSDKYLAKAWPSVTKLVTLGLDVRKSQPAEHPKRYKLFKEQLFLKALFNCGCNFR